MMTTTIDNALRTPDIHLTPERVQYVAPGRVRITLKTDDGVAVTYSVTIAMLMKMVNLSVDLMNRSPAQLFRDLGVF
jgi:hypothetical protein